MTGGLAGKRIVNTRAAHQAAAFDALLRVRGAVPLDYPCIAIIPPEDTSLLDTALFALAAGNYDWLVLSSANTVFAIAQRLAALGLGLAGSSFRSAAIGPATAEAARQQLGLEILALPAEYVAESLASSLPLESGTRVLLPESAIARPALADTLAARGARVTVVTAYQTVRGYGGVDIPHLLAQGQVDALTFTSSSTVVNFLARFRQESGRFEDLRHVCIACIGPKTAATARDSGLTVSVLPAEHTLDSLVDALHRFFVGQHLGCGG